jgi:site-specific DNA-methyltransferase (adenine-specific)
VFLREIAKRLSKGLEATLPDRQNRLNHIFTKQLFAIANTELTALLSRRSTYCSKIANGKYSICDAFDTTDGNIRYQRVDHDWVKGKCRYCDASRSAYDRSAELETHAYEFIHRDKPEEIFPMRFDVVIGNPPYQLSDGGFGSSAAPIYQKFVESAMHLNPRFVVMITPSRWFAGGKGLDDFRSRMLKDARLRNLVDYPKLYDGFPGVKIRGGVSYFLWDRDYSGPCTVQTMWDGHPLGSAVARRLDTYDVLVRRNEAVSILDKVLAFRVNGKPEQNLSDQVSSLRPFGLRTYFHGKDKPTGIKNPLKLYGSQRVSYVDRSEILHNPEWVDQWKVLMSRVQGTSAAVETQFLARPIVAGPGEACTETYLVAGRFKDERSARRYAAYLRTRFVRFLVSLRKNTHEAYRKVYAFVPAVPLNATWTDAKLYERYGITKEEVSFIESVVRPLDENND